MEVKQQTLDNQVEKERNEWHNKVAKEFMQYGILACGVSA